MDSLLGKGSQPFYIDGNDLIYDFHPGQWEAWDALERFILVLAGTQGGKTSWGPAWLHREIENMGPGDYMVVAPTYKLMSLKALPEFLKLFKIMLGLGDYKKSENVFYVSKRGEVALWGEEQEQGTRILFGYATDPDSLESATAKAAWLDEAGQDKFKLSSYEAILRRLSLAQGRVLITTTPYNLGWLKQLLFDVQYSRDDIRVVRFDSTENPSFPKEEMERARRDLPPWKFNMFYRALFTRPAGMIFDCFDESIHRIPAMSIPPKWRHYMGQDYGGVNTAAVYLAKEPGVGGRYILYKEYLAGGRTAKEHKEAMLLGESAMFTVYGGAKSEDQWRSEFSAAGLYVGTPPISDVEVGIDRVYGALKNGQLLISEDCPQVLDQLARYARELDDMGQPTKKIAQKETFHLIDALRYIGCAIWKELKDSPIPDQPLKKSKWRKTGDMGAGIWKRY